MPGIYCTVEGCWDSKESKHRFPNSNIYPELFRKWLDLCNKKALFDLPPNLVYSNYRVCRLHFAEEDFGRNNRLLKTAYPKLRLPVRVETSLRQVEVQEGVNIDAPSTSNVLKPSTSTQTLNNFDLPTTSGNMCDPQTPVKSRRRGMLQSISLTRTIQLTPRKKILYKQLCKLKKDAIRYNRSKSTFRERLELASRYGKKPHIDEVASKLNPVIRRFFESQLDNANRKMKGRRFTIEDKIFALALFKQSGRAYKLLSKIFALPSKQTLRQLLNRVPIRAGINDAIFTVPKTEVNKFQSPLDKYCLLVFDEMSLASHVSYNQKEDLIEGFEDLGFKQTQKIANHVQVFMLRGIQSNWKQPIYYAFVSGANKTMDIVKTIKILVKKSKEAGLIVCGIVCDQGTNNCAAVNKLVSDTRADKLRNGEDMDISDFYFDAEGLKIIIFSCPFHLKYY